MSLGIVIKAPEGLVLAAESRVTLESPTVTGEKIYVNFDNATKVLSFNGANSNIGVVTYGAASIGVRTARSFIPEFETSLKEEKLSVKDFSEKLSHFFLDQWVKSGMPKAKDYLGQDMTFLIAGYDSGEAYGTVYEINIPRNPKPAIKHANPNEFGISWGGQRHIVDRLLFGYDSRLLQILTDNKYIDNKDLPKIQALLRQFNLQLPIQFMPLQDCINLATLFIKTTINVQELTVDLRGCGGLIDVAIITRNNPLRFIQRKEYSV